MSDWISSCLHSGYWTVDTKGKKVGDVGGVLTIGALECEVNQGQQRL